MEISIINDLDSSEISYDDLISYLSQVVLCKTDEEIGKYHRELETSKSLLQTLQAQIEKQKKIKDSVTKQLAKEKQLSRVFNLISTLKKEGSIRGQNAVKISNVLNRIEDMEFYELRTLEEKLTLYLPDHV